MTLVEITNIAINKAKQSCCRYRISAIGLNKKGEIIGAAYNKPRFDRLHGGLHAEANLIRRHGKQISSIIICRVGNSGSLLPIKPCDKCKELAYKLNIKIVSISDVL